MEFDIFLVILVPSILSVSNRRRAVIQTLKCIILLPTTTHLLRVHRTFYLAKKASLSIIAFLQISRNIYIYVNRIYRKTFSVERYQKAPRRPPFIRVADSFCPEQACTIRGTKRKFVSLCSNTRHPELSVARNSRASLV